MQKKILIIAILAALAGVLWMAGNGNTPYDEDNKENGQDHTEQGIFTLKMGESQSGFGVTITPETVLEDSRCPVDVACIQAGTLRLRASVTSTLGSASRVFTLDKAIITETETITLISVAPESKSGESIDSEDYIFTFEISSREPVLTTQGVEVFFIALEDAGASGTAIGCGDSVIGVSRQIEQTIAPLSASLQLLLAEKDRIVEEGYMNALADSELSLDRVSITDGLASIHLVGNLSIAGVCDNPRVKAQIEETALQFPSVTEVEIFVNETPLDEILSGKGE